MNDRIQFGAITTNLLRNARLGLVASSNSVKRSIELVDTLITIIIGTLWRVAIEWILVTHTLLSTELSSGRGVVTPKFRAVSGNACCLLEALDEILK